jgi:hypothetical protein
MVLEAEIAKWRGFSKALRVEEREAFEAVIDACRSSASAASNATNAIVFESMSMSICFTCN